MDSLEGLFSGAVHGVESLGSDIGHGLSDIGGLFTQGLGGGGATGQPGAGTPGAAGLSLNESTANIPDLKSGGSGSPLSAASFSAGPGDTSPTDIFKSAPGAPGGGGDAGGGLTYDSTAAPYTFSGGDLPGVGGGATSVAGSGHHHTLLQDLIGAVPLGLSIAKGNKTPADEKALQALAGEQQNQYTFNTNLAGAAQNGQLPGGLEAGLQRSAAARKAQVRSTFASMGIPGGTAETDALNAVDAEIETQRFAMGQQLAQQGWQNAANEANFSDKALQELYTQKTARGTDMGNAIAEYMKFLVA